jgi:Holliday junction resolvasome RuvABC endonuclease subunit
MVAQANQQDKPEGEVHTMGIDQALRNVGVAFNHNGEVRAVLVQDGGRRGVDRLRWLRDAVVEIVVAQKPTVVALEAFSFGSTHRGRDLAGILDVLVVAIEDAGFPTLQVPPKSLKKFVTGSGAASKERMIKGVEGKWGFRTGNDNIADAVGLAKFAEVYLTERSRYRSELEAVRDFKAPATKKKLTFKKERMAI